MLTIKLRKTYDLFILFMVLACLGVCFTACNDSQVTANAYKTLAIAADTYDGSMQSAADLYSRGLIDKATKAKIIDIGHRYKTVHLVATNALEAYAKTTGARDEERLSIALSEVLRVIGDLNTILAPLLIEH